MPPKAISRPIRAAASSKNTARRVGFEVFSTYARCRRWRRSALRRVCRNAWVNEIPSSTKAMPSTTYAIPKSVAGSGFRSSLMPWLMETTAPAVNSPKAANIDQTYASLP